MTRRRIIPVAAAVMVLAALTPVALGLAQKAPLPGRFLRDRAFAELAALPTLKP